MRQVMVACVLCVSLSGCGSSDDRSHSIAENDARRSTSSAQCEDDDRDGFGIGCALGPDCDDRDSNKTDECYRCGEPGDGCPCSVESAKVSCGTIDGRTDDGRFVCIPGERVCKNGGWSACTPSDVLDERVHLKGLGAPVGCLYSCDPDCQTFPDVPDESLTDGTIVASSAGVTFVPKSVVRCADAWVRPTSTCEVHVPAGKVDGIDVTTLQLRYARNDGTIVRLARVAACSGEGFVADDPSKPTKLTLCSSSCADVAATSDPRVHVFYDCFGGGEGTFVRDYRIDCPSGTKPVWGMYSWNADVPAGATIELSLGDGSVPLRFSQVPGPRMHVGKPVEAHRAPDNTQVGAAYVDTSLALAGAPRNTPTLRVIAAFRGTTQMPLLKKWKQEVSCSPSESK